MLHRLVLAIAVLFSPVFVSAQTLATGDTRSVSQPVYPSVCQTLSAQFTSSQRSSPPSSDDTSRVQNALNACAGTKKSVVLASSGSNNAFYTGALTMGSNVTLVVNSGVTLYGNNSYSSAAQLIGVSGDNAAIMGPGAIDGRGDLISGTPRLVNVKTFTNFIAYNVTLQNAAKMHLYVEGGTGFTAWGVTINSAPTSANTDGIDIDSLSNATVYGSTVTAGDDGIAVKTNSSATSNVTVKNSTFIGTHGLSIGSQTMYGVTNVLFQDNYVYGKTSSGTYSTNNNGINIKSDYACGGNVTKVTYANTCMKYVKHLIILNSNYGSCSGNSGVPYFTNIIVNGAKSVSSQSGAYSTFNGYSSSYPLQAYLANVSLDSTTQQSNQYANVGLENSNITPTGTGVTTSTVSGISGSVPSCSFAY